MVAKKSKGPKTEAGVSDVLLLPAALEALEQQKQYTLSQQGWMFHNPQTNKYWETSQQIRRTQWMHILKKAGDGEYQNMLQTIKWCLYGAALGVFLLYPL